MKKRLSDIILVKDLIKNAKLIQKQNEAEKKIEISTDIYMH